MRRGRTTIFEDPMSLPIDTYNCSPEDADDDGI